MSEKFDSLIVLSDKSQLTNGKKSFQRLSGLGKNVLIVAFTEEGIESESAHIRHMGYYQDILKIDYLRNRQDASDLFYSLSKEKIFNNINLKDLTIYKGVSLWELSAHYVFSALIPMFYHMDIIIGILDLEKPEEVLLMGDRGNIKAVFSLACGEKKIRLITESENNFFFSKIQEIFGRIINFSKRVKRFFLSLYFWLLNLLKSSGLKEEFKVLFFAPSERFFFSMLPVILKYSEKERLVINSFFHTSTKKMKENRIFYMDFYGYSLYDLFGIKIRRFFRKNLHKGHLEYSFDKFFYRGIGIGGLLREIFYRTIEDFFPEKIREIDIVRKIILTHKPKTVAIADCCYSIFLIAKSLFVPSIGIQSMHPEDFIHFGPAAADIITVDGEFWKDYLLRHNLDSGRIRVVGSLRYEFLRKIKSDTLTNKLSGFLADYTGKRVLFASAYSSLAQGSLGYQNFTKLKMVCDAMKNIKNAHLIIKLHPYEKGAKAHEDTAEESGLLNYSILQDIDSAELLNYCDLIITHISAVGYEAVLMDKNVIILNNPADFRSDDLWDFDRYKAVMITRDSSELEGCIRKTLFDPLTQVSLKNNRSEYIAGHAYDAGCAASIRVKEIIDNTGTKSHSANSCPLA